jgi:hypothetical protein
VTTTTASGKVLEKAALPVSAATHPAAYAAMCLACHQQGVGVEQYPMAPSWPGTPSSPGPWLVTAGSPADHTGRTDTSACTQSGCHTWANAPVGTTTPTATGTKQPTSPEGGYGGQWTYIVSHPIDGAFANCLSCHIQGATGSTMQVTSSHNCDECHESDIPGASGYCPNLSGYSMEQTCLVCHYPKPS